MSVSRDAAASSVVAMAGRSLRLVARRAVILLASALRYVRRIAKRTFGRVRFALAPLAARIPLHVEPELGYLKPVADIRDVPHGNLPHPGVASRWAESGDLAEPELIDRLAGRIGGSAIPAWGFGAGGAPVFGVSACRVSDALYMPDFSVMVTQDGAVLNATVASALHRSPDLLEFPGVVIGPKRQPILCLSRRVPTVECASAFMAWGGRSNYGHFLLDSLSTLTVTDELGLLESHPPLSPPLTVWQSEALGLLLGDKAWLVRQTSAPLIRVRDLVYATTMDHFLHAPNTPLDKVRERMLSRIGGGRCGGRRLYLSRRGDEKRRMENEAELEAALLERGFEIVHARDLKVSDQIALFRDADVIAGPTGAALSNCLFCKPAAKVFEIQPSAYMGIWTRGLCHFVGAHWHGYFAPCEDDLPAAQPDAPLSAKILFEWRTPVADFLRFLDERL